MPNLSDGVKDKSCNPADNSVENSGKRDSFQNIEKNLAIQAGFRGFEKAPIVRLQRIDITPFLNNMKTKSALCLIEKDYTNDKSINCKDLNRLLHKCSVKLVRDDLDKLLESFMNKTATKTEDLAPQIEFIGMPNLKCNICGKAYLSEKRLQNHQENKHQIVYKPQNGKTPKRVSFSDHVIVHEVKEYHKCRKCTKIFEDYKSLKVHMKQKHRKRKCYICNYCSKKFVDRMFFKVHIRLHCDICGLLFQNKAKYLEHKRTVCRTLKQYKCKTCNEMYFKFMDLKDHSYEHLNTYFICDICKDQFITKCAVAHHILFLHSDKRPTSLYEMRNLGTDRLYLCNFCEESSVDRDFIEKHVDSLPDLSNRAMTGYKDYYFCDQCLKKFDMETDMLQHKWSHFLKTDESVHDKQNGQIHNEVSTKSTYKTSEEIPDYMQPKVVLEGIDISPLSPSNTDENTVDKNFCVPITVKNAIVDPVSKKTLISKYQCKTCGKYYSTNYCLNRHVMTQHFDYQNLQCKVCEETFVWPSLLQSHKCIRLNKSDNVYDTPGSDYHHFDNFGEITPNGFDDILTQSDDYANAVDFEIPAPIVELTEYENQFVTTSVNGASKLTQSVEMDKNMGDSVQNVGYKIIMQEVPIEF